MEGIQAWTNVGCDAQGSVDTTVYIQLIRVGPKCNLLAWGFYAFYISREDMYSKF